LIINGTINKIQDDPDDPDFILIHVTRADRSEVVIRTLRSNMKTEEDK
jgi:hypothetical protein